MIMLTIMYVGVNAEITYHIQSSNVNITGLLTIDRSSGVISKMGAGSFDRETTGNINLTVIAYDNGTLPLTGTAQVLIILLVSDGIILVYKFNCFYRTLMNMLQFLINQITPLMYLRMSIWVELSIQYQQLIWMRGLMQWCFIL